MNLKLYNTLQRQKEVFTPLAPPQVSLYTCGPTVYGRAHLGNLRTYVFEDILRRVLEFNGFEVNHVMNVTDVGHLTSDADEGEDKLEVGAQREHKSPLEIAHQYEQTFLKDIARLNILPPLLISRATETINDQIELIKLLEQKGFIYQDEQAIYFDGYKFPDSGQLTGQNLADKKTGARAEVVVDQKKKHPADFVLWFFLKGRYQNHILHWPSPWGEGFPGWHLECSAISLKHLGPTIDIHTGGIDHIPVHHTNEIAQSEAATGQPFVRFWLHGEFLLLDSGRMGKSEGNALTLPVLTEKHFDPLAFRFWVLQTHYRSKLNFSWSAVEAAQSGLERLRQTIRDLGEADPKIGCAEFEEHFHQAINDDLDTPKALAVMWEMLGSDLPASAKLRSLLTFDRVLGLKLDELKPVQVPGEVMKLVKDRESARQTKDWVKADELRKQIEKAGFEVEDKKDGPKVQIKL